MEGPSLQPKAGLGGDQFKDSRSSVFGGGFLEAENIGAKLMKESDRKQQRYEGKVGGGQPTRKRKYPWEE